VNTFVITARECSRALTDIRNREQPGIRSKFKGKIDEWHVEYRVTLLRVASWWALKWVSLSLNLNLSLSLVKKPMTFTNAGIRHDYIC